MRRFTVLILVKFFCSLNVRASQSDPYDTTDSQSNDISNDDWSTVPGSLDLYSLTPCDWNSPCPPDYKCQIRPDAAPDRFLCYPENEKFIAHTPQTPQPGPDVIIDGVTPTVGTLEVDRNKEFQQKIRMLNDMQCPPQEEVATCNPCVGVENCGAGFVCCPNMDGKRSCTETVANAGATTSVQQLVTGKYELLNREPLVSARHGSVTLIKTQGINIIVDTGSNTAVHLLQSALANHGLQASDIHTVIITHGHPDHYGGSHLFSGQHIYGRYRVSNDIFVRMPTNDAGQHYLCTKNAYVLQTPGHTHDDIVLIVERVRDLGTVAIVGDLFMNEQDATNPSLAEDYVDLETMRANRARIVCIADVIVPGHGSMFNVTDAMRREATCQPYASRR